MADEKLSKDLQFLEEKITELTKNNQELQKELEERKMEKDGLVKKYFSESLASLNNLFNPKAPPLNKIA